MTTPTETKTLMGIRARLFMGFFTKLFILSVAIVAVLYYLSNTENAAERVIKRDLPTFNAYLSLNSSIIASQASTNGWVMTHEPAYKIKLDHAWKNINGAVATLNTLSADWPASQIATWTEIKSMLAKITAMQARLLTEKNPVQLISTEYFPLMGKLLDTLEGQGNGNGVRVGGIHEAQYIVLQNGIQEIVSNLETLRVIELVLLGVFFVAAALITYFTAQSILKYIGVFREHSNRLATGDLTQRITVHSTDEMGKLGDDLNTMTDSLNSISKQTTEACHSMVSMLDEVKHSIEVQSSGATEQASSINQITASLEEIEKSSAQTIDKAKTLGETAERTREKGQQGLQAVEQSVNGMKAVREKVQTIAQTILDLSNQTQQVGEITMVVNTLAQQSKMLALNASIEAAKAGDAGKGFAVVADEVKNLAEQSEQSTTQVQKILEDIRHATERAVMATEEGTKGVDHGTILVEQTGDIVRSLSDVIHETTIASQQIEAAIRQESIGIEQITAGMNEINQVTASYVDSVTHTTEALENLSDISKNLKEYMDVYKV